MGSEPNYLTHPSSTMYGLPPQCMIPTGGYPRLSSYRPWQSNRRGGIPQLAACLGWKTWLTRLRQQMVHIQCNHCSEAMVTICQRKIIQRTIGSTVQIKQQIQSKWVQTVRRQTSGMEARQRLTSQHSGRHIQCWPFNLGQNRNLNVSV